ncbi:MAG TPA: hypothetical protein VH186_09705 [Chloroflexia bacterium]|nr:hypothetical protein [Chloroflexia bacterium]
MNQFEGGACFFKRREVLLLVIQPRGFAGGFIGPLASFKQVVIEPATFLKLVLQQVTLFAGWIVAIFEGFSYPEIISRFTRKCHIYASWNKVSLTSTGPKGP